MKFLRWLVSCKHPAFWLRNQEIHIVQHDANFDHVVMTFHCDKCHKDGEVRYATVVNAT